MVNNAHPIPLTLVLHDATATLERVGGKGASLAHMAAAGLPVPPGFHITTAAYRKFVMENGLQADILAAVATVAIDRPTTLEEASRQIERLFAQSIIPTDIAAAIRTAYAQLGKADLPVAVRSSATAEDLPEMSFAGQQETYLNMCGDAMVLDAVKHCWASLWTARAIGYRSRHTIAPDDVSLAVVVQQLIPADASGILFTANPLTGSHEQIMINTAWGLGEAIVGGQVTPDTVLVDKVSKKIIEQQISEKSVMTVRTSEGTREEPVPLDRRTQAVLNAAQAAELARIGIQIEDLYGQPMDIEWTLYQNRFFIVQARPITALPETTVVAQAKSEVEWKLPNPKGKYMRSSALELLPDPLSPLFATLGLPAWGRTMASLFETTKLKDAFPSMMFATINDYGYYDLTMNGIQALKMVAVLPSIFATIFPQLLQTSESRWRAERIKYAEVAQRWQATDLSTISAEYLFKGVSDLTEEAAAYYLTIQSGILPAAYLSEMFFTGIYDKFFKRRNTPSALTFMLGFDSEPIQAEKSLYDLAQWTRTQPNVANVLQKMTSKEFSQAYHEQQQQTTTGDETWAAFWQQLSTHLSRFGHTIYDLDFAKPLLADDPAPVLETLKFFISDAAPSPYQRQARAEAARKQATQTMLKQLRGLSLKMFRFLVNTAQNFAPLRENAIADVGLGWPIVRRMLREIGQRLVNKNIIDTQDDVFWLTQNELQTMVIALDLDKPLKRQQAVIAKRHATWQWEKTLTPPAALPLKGGTYFLGIDMARFLPANTSQQTGNTLKGIGASPGQITGVARVIHGPEEFEQMRQGDILVARITTPAWTPLFALAAGIVTDVGGPLSHSSIVAREYHIPAVLGTGVATERLSSGQRITVDGNAGTVTLFN